MTHAWLSMSMHHLQAYPSRSQMLFSWRKDNVPTRCFHDNNLGQESGTSFLSALCQETRPDVLNGNFSRFKQTKSYLHMLAPFLGPPRDATKLSLHWRDWKLLDQYPQASASTKGPVVLVVWYSYLFELGALSWQSPKLRNWWKLKSNCLEVHNHDETVK